MSVFPRVDPNAASRFFDKLLCCLEKASVPERHRRWYVKRDEEFIKAHEGRKIKSLSGSDIQRYFEEIGRQDRLAGWQFRQCVDAIRILYCEELATKACQEVDWDYWLNSAKELDAEHSTTARQLTPEELNYLKERRGEGRLQEVRARHRATCWYGSATEIRRRGYAYRTEQSYEQWIGRFILFCDGAPPDAVGASLVFLYKKVLGRELGSSRTSREQSGRVPCQLLLNVRPDGASSTSPVPTGCPRPTASAVLKGLESEADQRAVAHEEGAGGCFGSARDSNWRGSALSGHSETSHE